MVRRDLNGEKQAETLAGEGYTSEEIARIRRRLAALDAERLAFERELEALEQKPISDRQTAERTAFANAPVTNSSSSAEKIELFRRLFAGRPDAAQSNVLPIIADGRRRGQNEAAEARGRSAAAAVETDRRRRWRIRRMEVSQREFLTLSN